MNHISNALRLNRLALLMLCFSTFGMFNTLNAQKPQVKLQLGNNILSGDGTSADSPKEMAGLLKLRVDEMGAGIDLDNRQVRRLKLAADLVAKKIFQEQNKPLRAPIGITHERIDKNDDSFSDEDAEAKDDRTPIEQALVPLKVAVPVKTALKHQTWSKAVNGVLTEQQKTKWAKHLHDRDSKIRSVAVQYNVLHLQDQLRLREDQMARVVEIVDRIAGDSLVEQLKSGTPDLKTKVTAEDLKDVLSELQLEIFAHHKLTENKPQFAAGGNVRRFPRKPAVELGVGLKPNTPRLVVQRVTKASLAARLGVRPGDVINMINESPVDSRLQLRRALENAFNKTTITIMRDGKSVKLKE